MSFCPQCGTAVADGAKFCASCGNVLSVPTPAPETASQPAPTPETVSSPAPSAQTFTGTYAILGVKKSFEGVIKYRGVDLMSVPQLITMLSEIRDSERVKNDIAYEACDLNEKAEKMKNNYESAINPSKLPRIVVIGSIAFTVLSFIMNASDSGLVSVLGWLGRIPMIILTISAVIFAFICRSSNKQAIETYNAEYQPTVARVKQLIAEYYAVIEANPDQYITNMSALPDYYNSETALEYMINSLVNHRATSLKEVINLYERYKEDMRVRGILEEQADAQRATARAAQESANTLRQIERNTRY